MSLRGFRPYDLSTVNQRWSIRIRDDDCYVCRKFKYMKIFYRRSDALKQFKKVTKEEDIKQLMQDLNVRRLQELNQDPYKKLPLIFGSLLGSDIPCKRMLQVQHQAAINWAQAESGKRSGGRDHRDRVMRKLFRGIQEIMKADLQKVEQEDLQKVNATFAAWREYVLPEATCSPASDHIVNYPVFDASRAPPAEDDIFVYTGYFPPGVHHVTIFDPLDGAFYKMDNVAVYPRVEEIKTTKRPDELTGIENEAEEREAAEYHGDHYHYVRLLLYGDLLYDFSNRVGEFTCHHDLDPVFLDLKKFVPGAKSEEDLAEIVKVVQDSYISFLKVWRILQAENYDPKKLQLAVGRSQYAAFVNKVLSQF